MLYIPNFERWLQYFRARVYINGVQTTDIDTSPILTQQPRYRWIPRFFMRWEFFKIEVYVPAPTNVVRLTATPPCGAHIVIKYEA